VCTSVSNTHNLLLKITSASFIVICTLCVQTNCKRLARGSQRDLSCWRYLGRRPRHLGARRLGSAWGGCFHVAEQGWVSLLEQRRQTAGGRSGARAAFTDGMRGCSPPRTSHVILRTLRLTSPRRAPLFIKTTVCHMTNSGFFTVIFFL